MSDRVLVRTALLSVTDKTGVAALGAELARRGVQLISTGGTKKVLEAAGLAVTDIAAWTGNPEAFGGRMKTISFQVASGLLFDRTRDAQEAERLGIVAIDLVVANLYAFAHYRDQGLPVDELIEHIDIGGPTMIRAAAKNFDGVAVLTDPSQYPEFLAEWDAHDGATTRRQRQLWMQAAFALTARYDTAIAEHLCGEPLRYGENPHQQAVYLRAAHGTHIEVLGGKQLSYNNLVDLDAALAAARGLDAPACAIVKHENPCGLAQGPEMARLLELAWAGDPVSAFGGVIAFNRPVTEGDLQWLQMADKKARKFVEIVAAPDLDGDAVAYLAQNPNLRIVRWRDDGLGDRAVRRHLALGTLVQSPDTQLSEGLTIVSANPHAPVDADLVAFGLHAVRCLKSNAIAVVRRHGEAMQLLGMGAGQPNRLASSELAVRQAQAHLRREAADLGVDEQGHVQAQLAASCLASDAFFPFADGVQVALSGGITTVVEPGGSLRDGEVVDACNRAGATLIFSRIRHFKH